MRNFYLRGFYTIFIHLMVDIVNRKEYYILISFIRPLQLCEIMNNLPTIST